MNLDSMLMEKEGFIRAFRRLENSNVEAKEIATDAHNQITKFFSKWNLYVLATTVFL